MANIEVVGLGALNMDYLCHVNHILEDGEAVIKEFTLSPGGSAANTIYSLAKLGISTGFVGIVGNDEDGRLLIENFQGVGVDTHSIKVKPQVKTGTVICLSGTEGKRSLYVLPGANNLLTTDDLDINYINQANLLFVSSFAESRQLDIIVHLVGKLAPSFRICFAPGSIYAELGLKRLASILKKTHILFINHDELRQLTSSQDIVPGAKACQAYGCQIVVVTLGKGMTLETGKEPAISYIREGNREYIIKPSDPDVMEIIEATGAGDAFAAGFIFGWLQKKDTRTCGLLGDLVARFSMKKLGARQGLPARSDLASAYRRIYKLEL